MTTNLLRLARVAAKLRADAALSETLLPVRFMEESQEVFNLADFWLETLFHDREAGEHQVKALVARLGKA